MLVRENAGQGRGYWHEMGTVITDENMTAREAATKADLNYTITKRPLQARNPKGHFINVPSHFAIMSDYAGDPDVIAIVGKEFEPIQNMHLADMLDRAGLTGPEGRYAVDVAGKTADGRTVFWALKDREGYQIAGDDYKDHWLIADGKDGNRALTMALTPLRHICSNALAMSISGATIKVGIQHTKAAEAELGWWLKVAPQLEKAARETRGILTQLGKRMVSTDEVTAILERAYPNPKIRGKAQLYSQLDNLGLADEDGNEVAKAMGSSATELQRVKVKRETAAALFASYFDDADERNIAGTALGIINAVSDCENHRKETNVREVVGVSNMFGPRYQAQAGSIKAALELI